ncbi:MAG: hypothetical protein GC189_08960 [Alphaproteobacteria bacterium]|nr:hypothetical protein [Alphaproteobacteria bacterium]
MFAQARTVLLAIGAAMALTACGQSETAKTEAPPNTQAIADRTIGPDGAGGIAAALPFTQAAIAEAAVGYAVAQTQDQIEGDPYPKFTLSIGEEVVFDVLPTADRANVHAIVTNSSFAVGPEAEMMGATFGSAPAAQVLYCLTPEQHADYDFSCSSAADGQFWRGYDLPADYQGARAPFTAIDPDAATRATLVEMSWIAPRP